MKALILCNGQPPSEALLHRRLQQASLIICTDGACGWVLERGCWPQIVIGDMDSCVALPDCEIINAGPHDEQEDTDAEKAVLLALERGARQITLLGATGRRLDHTLGNVWLVARYHRQAEIVLVDDHSELRVISAPHTLNAPVGTRVSLMPLTEVSLETEGLRWPLHGPFGPGLGGISNEVIAPDARLDVHSGLLAVITPTPGGAA